MSDAAAQLAALIAEKQRRAQVRAEAEAKKAAEEEQAELEEQRAAEGRRLAWAEAASTLRSSLFQQQWDAFVGDKARRVADLCTRRAGKTFGGMREMIAFALDNAKSRQLYVNETRAEAKRLAWDEPDDGIIAVLAAIGMRRGERRGDGADFWANETELEVRFANGSKIVFYGADDERQIDKLRGLKWHRVWVDEAQKLPHLETLVKRAVGAAMADFQGQIWITGTPSRDASGYFFEVTRDDGQPAAPGWSVHRWAVVDNPFFGRVVARTVELDDGAWDVVDQFDVVRSTHETQEDAEAAAKALRWDQTAGEAIRLNGWKDDEPDLLREYYAKWVLSDANFVYPVHVVRPDLLTFAPLRLTAAGQYDHERSLLDLPRDRRGRVRQWLFSIGVDFGFYPDPFAIVMGAFALDHEVAYEMWSWKKIRTDAVEQKEAIDFLWQNVDGIVSIVGDPAGQRALMKGWRERLFVPIEDAEKNEKDTWIDLFGTAIRRNLWRYREDSPLLDEHRNLTWLPTKNGKREAHKHKKLLDGRVPGDHCSDGGLYQWRHMSNWLSRPDVGPTHAPGSPEAFHAEEERLHRLMEGQAKQVKADKEWGVPVWGGSNDDGGFW